MCGIVGFNWSEQILLQKMIKKIKHRGPDQDGAFFDDFVSLGHVRLSIQDLSENGKQPMHNNDGNLIITFNGEIYNFKEIRKRLIEKGYKFKTLTDTEVILYAYEEYGYEALELFNGFFSFVIYDKKNNILWCARDRIGIKPFYFYDKDNKFIFSSEIKGILEVNNDWTINIEALDENLALRYNSGKNTLWQNIKSLLPGSYLVYDLDKRKILFEKKYWSVKTVTGKETFEKYKIEVKDLIKSSIDYRLISDVPVATYLSGGLDSSIITKLSSEINKDIKVFSANYDEKKYSEEIYINKVIQYSNLDKNHKYIKIDYNNFWEKLVEAIYFNDMPLSFPASVAQLILAKGVKDSGIKVVLSGEGADELFAGYQRYFFCENNIIKIKEYSDFFEYINYLFFYVSRIKLLDLFFKKIFNNFIFYVYNLEFFNRFKRKSLLNHKTKSLSYYIKRNIENNYWGDIDKLGNLNKLLLFDLYNYLPALLHKQDRMNMSSGIEVRVPYLDHNLIEYSFLIPDYFKIDKNNTRKYLLKEAYKDILPEEIIKRKKVGFDIPYLKWVEDNKNLNSFLLNGYLVKNNVINDKYLRKLFKRNKYAFIFYLVNLEIWYRLFFKKQERIKILNEII